MKRGSNIVGVGAYNERLILSILRRNGAQSKAELAKRTGLSRQTLTDVVGRLEAEGRLQREELVRGKVGQPQMPFSLNPSGAYTIGLKVGRRSFELVLVDFVGSVVKAYREVCQYPIISALENFVETTWAQFLATTPSDVIDKIIGIGIAMPGELWRWTEEIHVPAEFLDKWETFDVGAFVESVTEMKTWTMNDVTSACIGEMMFGDIASKGDFIYFYVGAFVGGGLVMDDTVLLGKHSNAAAFGSMLTIDGEGPQPSPQQLLSRVSIIQLQGQLEAIGIDASFLWANDAIWSGFDQVLDEWIAVTGWHLAISAINAVAVVDVPQVVIDGSLPTNVRQRLVDATRDSLQRIRTTGLFMPNLVTGSLGYSARAVGAAALPMYISLGYDRNAVFKD